MKKFLSLLLILMLASSTAMAAEKKASKSKDKKIVKKEEKKRVSSNSGNENGSWVIQFQGDMSFLASSKVNGDLVFNYTGLGIGAEISVSRAINENFSVGILTGLHAFDIQTPPVWGYSWTGGSWSYTPLEVVAQYNFTGSSAKPYVLLGAGIANSMIAVNGVVPGTFAITVSETDLIISPGLGVAFELSDKANFFIQARVDVLAVSAAWTAPNPAGPGLLGMDGVVIPVQMGFNFSGI